MVIRKGSNISVLYWPLAKNITLYIIILVVEEPKPTKDGGYVYSFQVADDSGMVIANFWNEIGAAIRIGDILLMVGG